MNIRFTLHTILSFCITFLLLSCSSNEEPKPEKKPTKRTILVYMVANNNLASYAEQDLNEMRIGAKTYGFNDGRLIVYHASSTAATLKEVNADAEGTITTLKSYENEKTYSTEAERMKQVIDDVMKLAPAQDYGLILWSHADAWRETANSKALPINNMNIAAPLSFGYDRSKSMKISTLANVLNNYNFSFIYFDCCHMASVEVAYELRNATDYIVASGTELHASGMPYNVNVKPLFEDVPDLEEACNNTFNYYNSQIGISRTCSMSLIDTRHINELAQVSKEIFKAGIFPEDLNIQSYIRLQAGFKYSFLNDMQQYMHAISPNETLSQQWDLALSQVVKFSACTPSVFNQLTINHYCGIGCYIVNDLSDALVDGYTQQSWWKDVACHHFDNN